MAVIAVFFGVFWYANYLLQPVGPPSKVVVVNIPPGATVGRIGRRLQRAGAIRSSFMFQVAARLMGEGRDMKAGDYRIPLSQGVFQIIDRIAAGDAEAQWVVIPEGKTLSDIAQVLQKRRLAEYGAFMRAASHSPRRYGLEAKVTRRSVEGYLMPDTYRFPRRVSEPELIRQMVRNWNAKIWRPYHDRFARSGMPVEKIVTIASMIESEAKVPKDRPLISSVIRNRLTQKMPLQIDATVLFALGYHKDELSLKDLKVNSVYNTYRHKGLPPGPICNPGVASIVAALQPARTEYLYYVAQPDGSHIFSRTAAEHKAAIAQVKQMRAGSGSPSGAHTRTALAGTSR